MTVGWYRKLVLAAMLLTLFVVVLGAYVRLSDAGLGCPDWPGCYGKLSPLHAKDQINDAMTVAPHGPVSMAKAWKEMVHRYFASTLGGLILAIAATAWFKRATLRQSPWLPISLVLVVVFQGLLGMWTVTLLLKPAVVTAHLIGGMTTLALLTWLLLQQRFPSPTPLQGIRAIRPYAWLALLIACIQIVLGGWVSTNYAALACADFPTCNQSWLPSMDFDDAFHVFRELGMTAEGALLSHENLRAIHFTHRVGAVLTTLAVGALAIKLLGHHKLKPFGWLVLATLSCQILLGIANVLLQLPLHLAVAHNAGAALLLISLVIITYRLSAKEY